MERKILIADDDLELQDLSKFTFESIGYKVFQVYDGKDVLSKIKETSPDLLILDVMMPEMNGFEVMETLRSDAETCLIPVIMLTSLSHMRDKLTGLKLGADEYLVKPVDPYELISKAENLIKKYSENVNFLTKLPGLEIFEQNLNKILSENLVDFNIIYIELCNFEPYSIKYGLDNGNKILKFLSSILRSTVVNFGSKKDELFHIDISKFVIITYLNKEKTNELIENIIFLFKDLVNKLFDEETIKNGYFNYISNDGEEKKSNLTKLAICGLEFKKENAKNYKELISCLNELLTIAINHSIDTNDNVVIWG